MHVSFDKENVFEARVCVCVRAHIRWCVYPRNSRRELYRVRVCTRKSVGKCRKKSERNNTTNCRMAYFKSFCVFYYIGPNAKVKCYIFYLVIREFTFSGH